MVDWDEIEALQNELEEVQSERNGLNKKMTVIF